MESVQNDENCKTGASDENPASPRSSFSEIEELETISIPENTSQLYKLLLSCNLIGSFQKFVDEDFDDQVIAVMDPRNHSLISKILPKIGSQIKFQNALSNFQESSRNQTFEREEAKNETNEIYKAFNEHQVSLLLL